MIKNVGSGIAASCEWFGDFQWFGVVEGVG